MELAEYERLNPRCEISWEGKSVLYATPNRMTRWRAETLFEKEPATLRWMGALGPEAVLADIGANVGMYSIWAAKVGGARVWAFEPEAQNFALLNRNIQLNGLGDRVRAYCVALSDQAGYSELHVSEPGAGSSNHAFGESLNFKLEALQAAYVQGCAGATLDELVGAGVLPQPTHIKIDVDGFEHKVVAGAARTLRDKRLRSMIVEINRNLAVHRALVEEIGALGFRWDEAQVAAAERRSGPFLGLAEYVFDR
jgi:FkbM family methyltransferase